MCSPQWVPTLALLSMVACEPAAAAVLVAADTGEAAARRNQRCYAHLYLGLHAEATGDHAQARKHIVQAAGPFRMDHYMGKVAVVHAALRGWEIPNVGADGPALPQR